MIRTHYDIAQAHADGRHANAHPEDRVFWAKSGCSDCRNSLTGTPFAIDGPQAKADAIKARRVEVTQ